MAHDDRPRLQALLLEYCNRVPPAVNAGSYNTSVRFKSDVVAARKVASKRGVTEKELNSAINNLHRYWTASTQNQEPQK